MVQYKLTYFNGRGRGELARLIFAAAGVQYEDVRIEHDQWPTVKPTLKLPFGQIPILTFEGVTLCQSITIGRFLARKFNLAGKTELEQARADMIVGCVEDVNEAVVDFAFHEPDKTRQAEKHKAFLEEKLPRFLQQLENLLKENNGGNGYFVGDSLTWADINFVVLVSSLSVVGAEGQLANYPNLSGLNERVKKLPKIAEWIAKRPATPW